MLGHTLALLEETDQAMNVYRQATRLFPGSAKPHLYIGMDYLRVNNLGTALMSLKEAKKKEPNDPFILNEIGVVFFKQKSLLKA